MFATKPFAPGSFLLNYPGDLISEKEAEKREKQYSKQSKGCFMYFFEHEKKIMW